MSDNKIGDLDWEACATCQHELWAGGCAIEDEIDLVPDFVQDTVRCDNYKRMTS